jgi:hypothetical protein
MNLKGQKLGDFSLDLMRFPNLEKKLGDLVTPEFLRDVSKRMDKINSLLLSLIQETKTPCFLLAAVNEFIDSVMKKDWIPVYSLSHFEFWLNQFSLLSEKENYEVRAKIMGKSIPREAYQVLFPVGMGKTHFGSHYVTAHSSPDLDTTVASFWGWVDAFAARVGTGLHIWNVPGGPPRAQVEIGFLFHQFLGKKCFDYFAKTRGALALSALDFVTQKGIVKKLTSDSSEGLDSEKAGQAIVLTDKEGRYLSDWRQLDVEGVRKVTMLLNNCMRWFASYFQRKLTALFALEKLDRAAAENFVKEIFSLRLADSALAGEFTAKQRRRVNAYLTKVLKVQEGWDSTFDAFWEAMEDPSLEQFLLFRQLLTQLPNSILFDSKGNLVENRAQIFGYLEKVVASLEGAIQSLKKYVDQLGVALLIKKEVFGFPPRVVSPRAEVEEIRRKMGPLSYLTVTESSESENEPAGVLGVVRAADINRTLLGTVTLRDFCNREETKIPVYFEVISVIDHHKSVLSTASAPVAFIADAQSANSLVAEMAFVINDEYTTSGCVADEIEKQFSGVSVPVKKPEEARILQRLLQRQMSSKKKEGHFIDPRREYLEYLQYLYAILDDTDLLSKVSYRDVICVASLLSRMKSIMLKQEVEVVSFDDIPQDEKFVAAAAKRILQNDEMYSLYQKVYASKEEAIEESLRLCVKGEESSVFADTKVQNGSNRVGQTKLFVKNFPSYLKYADKIRAFWYVEAKKFYEHHMECDLHMQMISTVPSAEDVYAGNKGEHAHKDELWIWIPLEEQAIEHLKSFLSMFKSSPQINGSRIEVEFLGEDTVEMERIFAESFKEAYAKVNSVKKISVPVAVLRYKAGLLNSRKGMISPYLPKLVR